MRIRTIRRIVVMVHFLKNGPRFRYSLTLDKSDRSRAADCTGKAGPFRRMRSKGRVPLFNLVLAASVVPKHRQQDDDGDRNTEQPKKSASTETHDMSSSELDLAAV